MSEDKVMNSIRDIIVMIVAVAAVTFGGYCGYKVGYGVGYVRGTMVKINPFKRDKEDRGRLLPFFPGEQAPIGQVPYDAPITVIEEFAE